MTAAGAKPIKDVLVSMTPTSTAGIIASIQRITTKTGQPMLFAKIEDLSNAMEVIVFPETLAKNPMPWKENNIILVSGKMSWRNGEPKLICDSAREL